MSYYGQARYGIKLSDLTYEVLEKIIAIYDLTVGGKGIKNLYPGDEEEIKDKIKLDKFVERRFGSLLTEHSKLEIRVARIINFDNIDYLIYFKFSENTAISTDESEKTALNLSLDFARRLEEFFIEQNIAIKL